MYVVELDPVVEEHHRELIQRYNPSRDRAAPYVYVHYAVDPHPTIRFRDGFDDSKNEIIRRWGRSLNLDDRCTGNATSRLRILERVERTIARLRGLGWTVLNQPPEKRHRVYVCELEPVAGDVSTAREANPDPDLEMPSVYVGQTGLSIEKRIEKHLAAERVSSPVVRDRFRHLLPGLYEHLNPLTELESLRKERWLGKELRRCGYSVYGAT